MNQGTQRNTKPAVSRASRPPSATGLLRAAQRAWGPSGRLVWITGPNDTGWWEARAESDRAKSAILVRGCSRNVVARAMLDVLNGIAARSKTKTVRTTKARTKAARKAGTC